MAQVGELFPPCFFFYLYAVGKKKTVDDSGLKYIETKKFVQVIIIFLIK